MTNRIEMFDCRTKEYDRWCDRILFLKKTIPKQWFLLQSSIIYQMSGVQIMRGLLFNKRDRKLLELLPKGNQSRQSYEKSYVYSGWRKTQREIRKRERQRILPIYLPLKLRRTYMPSWSKHYFTSKESISMGSNESPDGKE